MSGRTISRIVALTAIGLIAGAPEAGAKSKSGKPRLNVQLPAPGHIGVQTLSVTVKGKARKRLPKRLSLKALNSASLPPTVRVLYASRTIKRKRSTTFALALLSVNVKTARVSSRRIARVADDDTHKGGDGLFGAPYGQPLHGAAAWLLFFGGPLAAEIGQQINEENERENSGRPRYKFRSESTSTMNLDIALPAQANKVGAELNDLFKGLPNNDGLVFEAPRNGTEEDPTLDTGHYNDGHAFGWGIKNNEDEKLAWTKLTLLADKNFAGLVTEMEAARNADINGDGTTGGPGQQIDTTIGKPIITNP